MITASQLLLVGLPVVLASILAIVACVYAALAVRELERNVVELARGRAAIERRVEKLELLARTSVVVGRPVDGRIYLDGAARVERLVR